MEPLAVLLMLVELAAIAPEMREEFFGRAIDDTIIGARKPRLVAEPDRIPCATIVTMGPLMLANLMLIPSYMVAGWAHQRRLAVLCIRLV